MVTKSFMGGCKPMGLGLRGPPSITKLGRPSQRNVLTWAADEGKDLASSYGGGPPGSDGPGGGDGGRGDGDGDGNGAAPVGAILAGKALETLPAEMAQALKDGKLPAEMLQRYVDMNKNPFLAWLMSIG